MAKRRRTRDRVDSASTAPTSRPVVGAGPARAPRDSRPRPSGLPWPAIAGIVGLVIVVAVVTVLFFRPSGIGGGAAAQTPSGSVASTPSASVTPTTASGACPTSQPPALAAGETRTVTMGTDLGTITMKLEADLSPIAVGNFVALAACGYYDGVVFHRTAALEDGTPFVIQGGDPDGTGTGGPGYEIEDEPVTATYARGVVAMARTAQPNSVGSQFFIVLDDAARGPLASANTYQILGTVTAGMDVADAVFEASGGIEIPSDPVAMTTVTIANP